MLHSYCRSLPVGRRQPQLGSLTLVRPCGLAADNRNLLPFEAVFSVQNQHVKGTVQRDFRPPILFIRTYSLTNGLNNFFDFG